MENIFDVIVVGAGPAGSACTKRLKDASVNVLCLEHRTRPRYKACGGLLSNRCQSMVTDIFGQSVPNKIACATAHVKTHFSRIGTTFLPLYDADWLSVERHEFDYWLNSFIEDKIEKARFVSAKTNSDGLIEVTIRKEGTLSKLFTRYLVGADGGNSLVRRIVDPRIASVKRFRYLQYLYEGESGMDSNGYYFLTGSKFTDLLAAFCIKNNLIYIGTTHTGNGKVTEYLKNIEACIAKNFGLTLTKKVRGEGCAFTLSPYKKMFHPGSNNILLTGESAGLISAFGEGIPSALNSGSLAGLALVNSLNSNTPALPQYTESLHDELEHIKKSMGAVRW